MCASGLLWMFSSIFDPRRIIRLPPNLLVIAFQILKAYLARSDSAFKV
jgi:hypothetical protein